MNDRNPKRFRFRGRIVSRTPKLNDAVIIGFMKTAEHTAESR